MPPIQMVLFDCDGVLVDSEPLTNRLMQEDLARFGLSLQIEDIHGLFRGGTMLSVREEALRRGAALPDDWIDLLYEKMFALLHADCDPMPGAIEILDRLDAVGIPYAVGSNGPMEKMRVTLGRNNMWERFQGRIYSAHDAEAFKPDPAVYMKAAAQAGVAPKNCVVIEDSPSGAAAGYAAGMQVFGYIADTDPIRLQPFCRALFSDMRDLPALLGLSVETSSHNS